MAYIFLDRSWETDQEHIDRILSYFVELDSKHNILFFPEGNFVDFFPAALQLILYCKLNSLTQVI